MPSHMDRSPLPSQNPVNLICFLLLEADNLTSIDDVYAKLGTGFEDISTDQDVQKDWHELGLTSSDCPYLLRFSAGSCRGEMEIVFSGDRLVQAGVQVFGESSSSQPGPVRGTFTLASAFIGSRFSVMEVAPSHLMFNDRRYNGYLRSLDIPGGCSTTFRMADLRWCERVYGPNSEFSLSRTARANSRRSTPPDA